MGELVSLCAYRENLQKEKEVKAQEELASYGLTMTVADARFAKPLDHELLRLLARNHEVLITIEEGSSGGFGAHVSQFLMDEGLLDGDLKVRVMTMPDDFFEQDNPELQIEAAGLTSQHIVSKVLSLLGLEASKQHITIS